MCVIDADYEAEMALRERAADALSAKEADRLISAADKLERRRENRMKLRRHTMALPVAAENTP